jgi:hypothetical protein
VATQQRLLRRELEDGQSDGGIMRVSKRLRGERPEVIIQLDEVMRRPRGDRTSLETDEGTEDKPDEEDAEMTEHANGEDEDEDTEKDHVDETMDNANVPASPKSGVGSESNAHDVMEHSDMIDTVEAAPESQEDVDATTPVIPMEPIVMDVPPMTLDMVHHLLDGIASHTGGFSLEQLERVRTDLMRGLHLWRQDLLAEAHRLTAIAMQSDGEMPVSGRPFLDLIDRLGRIELARQ